MATLANILKTNQKAPRGISSVLSPNPTGLSAILRQSAKGNTVDSSAQNEEIKKSLGIDDETKKKKKAGSVLSGILGA